MVSKKSENCPHCEGGFGLKYPLYVNEHFWIVCDVHPIAEGHILIIPKNHISCMGALSSELFNKYGNLYKKVLKFLNKTYGDCVIFEHGAAGQTVFHAHTHFIPFNQSITDVVNEAGLLKPIEELKEIRNAFKEEHKYLYVAINEEKWLVDTKIETPGFFRNRVSKALNLSERGDWRKAEDSPKLMSEFERDIQELINKWNNYVS